MALDQVDLNVAEGEFVSVIGPTGCGKSALLNALPKVGCRRWGGWKLNLLIGPRAFGQDLQDHQDCVGRFSAVLL